MSATASHAHCLNLSFLAATYSCTLPKPEFPCSNLSGNQFCGSTGSLGTPVGTVGQNNPNATRLVPSVSFAACSGILLFLQILSIWLLSCAAPLHTLESLATLKLCLSSNPAHLYSLCAFPDPSVSRKPENGHYQMLCGSKNPWAISHKIAIMF